MPRLVPKSNMSIHINIYSSLTLPAFPCILFCWASLYTWVGKNDTGDIILEKGPVYYLYRCIINRLYFYIIIDTVELIEEPRPNHVFPWRMHACYHLDISNPNNTKRLPSFPSAGSFRRGELPASVCFENQYYWSAEKAMTHDVKSYIQAPDFSSIECALRGGGGKRNLLKNQAQASWLRLDVCSKAVWPSKWQQAVFLDANLRSAMWSINVSYIYGLDFCNDELKSVSRMLFTHSPWIEFYSLSAAAPREGVVKHYQIILRLPI